MPASRARPARSSPTLRACSLLAPSAPRRVLSRLDAEARVRPWVSSTICATMCRRDRVTTRRGRVGVPKTFLRTRKCRRALPTRRTRAGPPPLRRLSNRAVTALPAFLRSPNSLLTGLSSLTANDLALVLHALALVRLRRPDLPDVRGDLAHLLFVDALDAEQGGPLDTELDAGRRGHQDRVREPERELQVAALGGDPVAGTVDLQDLPVALGHPDDHVGDQGTGEPVQLLGPPLVVGAYHGHGAVVGPLGPDGLGQRVRQLALGTLHPDGLAVDGDVHARGYGDRLTSDARHCLQPPVTRRRRGLPRPPLACGPAGRSAAPATSR